MEDKELLNRIIKVLDEVRADVVEVKVTLAVNTESLKVHIKRTELLEAKVEPIDAHVKMVHGTFKFIGALSVLAGLVATALKLSGAL
ncbi:MAG: hypothetical protein NVS1B10_06680 [Candidatus Saccharimonadales bacterium]